MSNNKPSRFGLGQQQAIKGIAVQRRQLGQRQDMGGLDRQPHKAPIQQRAPQHRRLHLKRPASPERWPRGTDQKKGRLVAALEP